MALTGLIYNTSKENDREQWRCSLAGAGLSLVNGSFEEGATVNSRTDVVWYISGGQCYAWRGELPKDIPAGTTPVGVADWEPQTDLRDQWLYDNKLQRTDPFGDIKSDGEAAISTALTNLGLTEITTVKGIADSFPYFSGPKSAELTPLTEFARNLLSKPDDIDARTALKLGNAALKSVGTGPGQLPDMSEFVASFAASGYQKLPGGLILQWGISPGITTSVSIIYPIPFPNARLSITANPVSSQGGAATTAVFSPGSKSSCTMTAWGSNNYTATWIAIGY